MLLVIMAGCAHHKDNYFLPVTDKAYHEIITGAGREVFGPLDSLYRADRSNGELLLRIYQCKKEFYYRHEVTDTNNIYVDSIIYTLEHFDLKDKYPAIYADALNNKGNMFFEVNDLKTAFEYYYKARVAVVMTGDTCLLGDQSYHLGMICYRQEKYSEAISHFQSSMDETGRCKAGNVIFYRRCELMTNIALSLDHLGFYDSALVQYGQLLTYIDTEHVKYTDPNINKFNEVAHAVAYGNIANVYIKQQKFDTAIALLKKGIAVNSKTAYDNRDALYSSMKLAELYNTLNDDKNMLLTLQSMKAPMDSMRDEAIVVRWNLLMYDYYKLKQDWHSAVNFIDPYLQHKESVEQKTKTLKQTDYAQVMQNQEKEYQLSLLRKNNQVANAYLIASGSFIVIILIAIVGVLYIYTRSRKNLAAQKVLNDKINEQNKQLETAMSDLVSSNREKDRILHVVAHDLRSPVSAITMIVELVMDETPEGEQKDMLRLINTSCQSQLALINELLARSNKSENNKKQPTELFDMNELVNNSTALLRFRAKEKNQELVLQDLQQPVMINANKENIARVVSNLITNAIKFSPANEKIYISLSATNKEVTLCVKDNGIGIPEKNKSQVFEAFTSAKRRGTSGEQSFGLGLSISKQIIEDNNGRIWFESEEDNGSAFYISLPVVE